MRKSRAGQTRLVAEREESIAPPRTSLWRALRLAPAHAADIAVLHALPQLTPHVRQWASKSIERHPSDPPERLAGRVLRRSTHVARRAGLITGSSFYVGLPPAMAMIYFEQLIVVLRIAAVYGRDPTDPARAAEVLVVQGRYQSVSDASAALQRAGAPAEHQTAATGLRTSAELVRQLPSMIGLQVRKFTAKSPIDMIIAGVEVASFFVPIVSIPVWAVANSRATRKLGRAAIDFYGGPVADPAPTSSLVLPARPRLWVRRLAIGTLVPLALALGVLLAVLPLGRYSHHLHVFGFVLGELALVLIFFRLVRVTRAPGRG
jgi:hypothetical protein